MADQKLSKEQRAAIVRDFEMALRAALAEADQQTAVISKHMFGGAGFYGDGEFFAAWFGDDSLHLETERSGSDRVGETDRCKSQAGRWTIYPAAAHMVG
ncbi:MAG: hypothetical protein KF726_20880 [Anaerolineae bacterium]|nr:hypothetical protein [Anaerolineae bacterium]